MDEIVEELKGLGVPDAKLKPIRFWERKRKRQQVKVEDFAYRSVVDGDAFILSWSPMGRVTVRFRASNMFCEIDDLEFDVKRTLKMQDRWMPLVEKAFQEVK